MNSETMKTIEEHKKMLIFSGNLSDFQLDNLQKWPYIVFDGIKTVNLAWDFKQSDESATMNSGSVTFDFVFNKKAKVNEIVKKRAFESLNSWVKDLFFMETKVIFKKNGKKWS